MLRRLKNYNLNPIAKILSFADAAQAPEWFTTAPTKAAPKALSLAKMSTADVDYFEVNEAFSVVPLAFNKILDVDILTKLIFMEEPFQWDTHWGLLVQELLLL